jgi:hypothetical protein
VPSPITVTATVQDPSSTSLSGGCFVRFKLRNFTGFVPQVSGTSILPEIQVDAVPVNGAISQTLWKNSDITPSTTFYTVELWNLGRPTSSGNYIFNANTSLNSATQVNAPPVPSGFSLVLENNGALNSSQSTLNLVNTDGTVTITDLGSGNIQLNSAGSVAAGTNIVQTPAWGGTTGVWPQNGSYFSTLNTLGHTVWEQISSGLLLCNPSRWKATIGIVSASVTITLVIAKCTRGTNAIVSTTAVTFGGQSSPTLTGSNTTHQSDSISFAFAAGFDYYFALNSSTNLIGIVAPGTNQSGLDGGTYVSPTSDLPLGATLPSFTGGSTSASNHIIFDLVAA